MQVLSDRTKTVMWRSTSGTYSKTFFLEHCHGTYDSDFFTVQTVSLRECFIYIILRNYQLCVYSLEIDIWEWFPKTFSWRMVL